MKNWGLLIIALLWVCGFNCQAQDDIYATPDPNKVKPKSATFFESTNGRAKWLLTVKGCIDRTTYYYDSTAYNFSNPLNFKPQNNHATYLGVEYAVSDKLLLQSEIGKSTFSSYYENVVDTGIGPRIVTRHILLASYMIMPVSAKFSVLEFKNEVFRLSITPSVYFAYLLNGESQRNQTPTMPSYYWQVVKQTENFSKFLTFGGAGLEARVKLLPYLYLTAQTKLLFSLNSINNGVLLVVRGTSTSNLPIYVTDFQTGLGLAIRLK